MPVINVDIRNRAEATYGDFRHWLKKYEAIKGGEPLKMSRFLKFFVEEIWEIHREVLVDLDIEELGLSERVTELLRTQGVLSIGSLLDKTADDLLEERRFGMGAMKEVWAKLAEHSLVLKGG